MRADIRDLLIHDLRRQAFLHQRRQLVLQDQAVDPAHHHHRVEPHQQRRHRPAEPKSAMQQNQRDRQQREPDVCAEPSLHRAEAPLRQPFPHAQQRRENKNPERNRAEHQPERSAADRRMSRWRFAEKAQAGRHLLWVKFHLIEERRRRGDRENEDHPWKMCGPVDSHASPALS
ncbi:MAG: hypothetical protein H0V56_05355 [Chthoniobacterales bacterium]|nr:hypothetical protein [Chthoniobacterales bacterium]